jgi:hypothetical protein
VISDPKSKLSDASVPRLAYRLSEAASALGASDDWFRAHVIPEIKLIRRGRKKLVPHSELVRWIAENSSKVA